MSITFCASAALTAAIACFFWYMQDMRQIAFGIPGPLELAEWCGRIGALLTMISTASVVILWARGLGRTSGRVAHSVVVICQVTLVLWAARWSLLG